MKRDMELVRELLLAVETDTGDPREWVEIEMPGRSRQEISYHVQLLAEGGFLEANDASSHGGYDWQAQRLTWQGHEFLDTVRDAGIWREMKEGARKAGSMSLQFLWEVGKGVLKQEAAKHGVPLG